MVIAEAGPLRSALRDGIQRSGTLPVLSMALIEGEGECLRITTTDLEKWLTVEVPCEPLAAPFAICADPDKLRGGLHGLDEPVSLVPGKAGLAMTYANGKGRCRIPTLPADEFPAFREEERPFPMAPGPHIIEAAARVLHAAPSNDPRYFMNGVFVGHGLVAATNGHRVAMVEVADTPGPGIIPRATAALLVKLGADDGEASIGLGTRTIHGSGSGWRLLGRLIDGQYPDLRQHIPPPDGAYAAMEPTALLGALERIRPFCQMDPGATSRKQGTGSVEMLVDPEGAGVTLRSAVDPDTHDVVPLLEALDGVESGRRLDPVYLMDVLRQHDGAPRLIWRTSHTIGNGAGMPISLFTYPDRTECYAILGRRE